MRRIYIVLTYTGTILSKIIKSYTKNEFAHVSISLDIELEQMYSFGRIYPWTPLIGGFVHEHINKGTFKKFNKTISKIYYLEVTEEQYEKIKNNIKKIEDEKENYKFNILGLFGAGFKKKIKMKHSFYCAEFVKYILETSNVYTNLPEPVKPEDFKYMKELKQIYKGLLNKYEIPQIDKEKVLEYSL